jgi:adenosylcobinamide-phosphate synthase
MLPVALALAIDRVVGEPPASLHPVVWMGRLIALLERHAPRSNRGRLLYGAAGTGAVVSLSALCGLAAQRASDRLPYPARMLAMAWLLKTTFAVRSLSEAAVGVRTALLADDLTAARERLRSLVSRDVAALSPALLAAAATESVAENTADSVVAPLLYYLVADLPGALAYRAANTLDAMWGYHGRYEHLGKTAARLDDLANLVPGRLTGLLFVGVSALTGQSASGAWRIMVRDHRCTASPNAGWPMSAMAGALGVELEKAGHYRLGSPAAAASQASIQAAVAMLQTIAALLLAGCLLVEAAHASRR